MNWIEKHSKTIKHSAKEEKMEPKMHSEKKENEKMAKGGAVKCKECGMQKCKCGGKTKMKMGGKTKKC
jgi:hypothetical protein